MSTPREHQSSYNPNMPLRFLIYLAELYAGMVKGKNLYGTKLIPIPAPRFIVFYNGEEKQPKGVFNGESSGGESNEHFRV